MLVLHDCNLVYVFYFLLPFFFAINFLLPLFMEKPLIRSGRIVLPD